MIFELLKFIGGALLILDVVYWWITKGPPPRGKADGAMCCKMCDGVTPSLR